MNELPDELWHAEQSHTRATHDLSANDADGGIALCPYTTEESVLLVALGVLAIAFSSAAMVSLAATVGWSTILIKRKLKGGMFNRGEMNGVSLP